uniref:PH domain-containing protein n=1 Tax=Lepeophtheirus salmonis TaxID=72036 RepID=A0A0K2T8C0_LEPSM
MSNTPENCVEKSSSNRSSWRKNFFSRLKLRTNKLYEWDWKKQSVTQSDPDPGGGEPLPPHPGFLLHPPSPYSNSTSNLHLSQIQQFQHQQNLQQQHLNSLVAAEAAAAIEKGNNSQNKKSYYYRTQSPDVPLRADTLPRNTHGSNNGSPAFAPLIRSNSTGTTASVTSSDYGFQDWGKITPRTTILQSRGGRTKSGKSVRFGENRINVFLQDSTQHALEEAVKLALSYASGIERPGISSDSEVVPNKGEASKVPFYSDSENQKHVYSSSIPSKSVLIHPSEREVIFQGTNGSSGLLYSSTSVTSTANATSTTAVTSSRSTDSHKYRRRSNKNINEIFSFIDKVLSGCNNEEGCSDSDCPVNRKRRRRRKKNSYYYTHFRPRKTSNIYDSDDSDEDESGSVASSASTYHRKRLTRSTITKNHRGRKGGSSTSFDNLFTNFHLEFEDLSASSSSTGTCMPSFFSHVHTKISQEICNAIFLCKISDEDRMSLTTAVSDEEEVESNHNSPYKTSKASSSSAASFNCTGAVRKAGFLSVKKWLLRKKHQVELARKRGWKGYWVCLKGTTLLFYPCDSREGRSVEATPKHLIIVDGAIMQAIPEHPKRDYIFCLSTAFGDAYLFQAPCQVELENWVNSIHSACAAAFARHRGKTGTLHLLQEEIYRLDKGIESDQKLKHMAELQLSVVSEQNSKHQIDNQITQWEENLERLHCEQFRLRCYMASLQSEELPNPKSVLTQVTPSTKVTLNRLGVFTVSSFHAYICARSPSLLNNLLAGRGATKRRAPVLSRSNSGSSRRSLTLNTASGPASSPGDTDKLIKVTLPDNQVVTFYLNDAMTVDDFLAAGCLKKGLNPVEHFVRVKKRRDMPNQNYFVPHRSDLIETYLHTHEIVEVCAKILYQVELSRDNLEIMWGFSVEAELVENSEKQDELCCYVSRVEERSVAMSNGSSSLPLSSLYFWARSYTDVLFSTFLFVY